MNIEDIDELDSDLKSLWIQLQGLRSALRSHTMSTYQRTNPFVEDLFEWKEKGSLWGGEHVTIYDSTTVVGDVSIGDHSWIGPFCALDGVGGLSIGRYCAISAGTSILTHDTAKWALSGGKCPYEYSPTHIGDCCFIGANSVVTRGNRVGDHCLIGAGAVVTRDVPPFSVAAGIPARVIGHVELTDEGVEIRISKRE